MKPRGEWCQAIAMCGEGDCVAPTVLGDLLRFIPRAMALGCLISHRWGFEGNGVAPLGLEVSSIGRVEIRYDRGAGPLTSVSVLVFSALSATSREASAFPAQRKNLS